VSLRYGVDPHRKRGARSLCCGFHLARSHGLTKGTFVPVWRPVPAWVPAREPLAYLCALISLACGIGLLWQRTAAVAARVLFVSLMVWLLVLRLPNFFFETPLVLVAWMFGSTAVMVAAAWVLYVWFASDRDRQRFGLFADDRGVRIARILYGLSLVPFGRPTSCISMRPQS